MMRVPSPVTVALAVVAAFAFGWGLGLVAAYAIVGKDFGQLPAVTVPLCLIASIAFTASPIARPATRLAILLTSAAVFNLPVVSHVIPEFHAHLIAAVPNGLTVEYMPWMLKLFEETPALDESELVLSDRSGFGLAFDRAAIERFAV